jgi:hypothetical protein
VHHKLEELLDEYLRASGLGEGPGSLLFPAALGKNGKLSRRPLVVNCGQIGTGKNLEVKPPPPAPCDDSEVDHRVYLPSSPLSSAQRAWSNICAPCRVQCMCCFFSIRPLIHSRLHARRRYTMACVVFPAVVVQSFLVSGQVRPQCGQPLANLLDRRLAGIPFRSHYVNIDSVVKATQSDAGSVQVAVPDLPASRDSGAGSVLTAGVRNPRHEEGRRGLFR